MTTSAPPGLLERHRARGRLAPDGRDLVAEGFRWAVLLAVAFLLLAALAASRMPRLTGREPVSVPAPPAARAGAPAA